MPHQVALEFHRRRVDAVADRLAELESLRDEAAKATASTKSVVNRLGQRARALRGQIPGILEEQSAALEFVDKIIAEYDLKTESVAGGQDAVYPQIQALLEGRVGLQPTAEQLEVDQAEGLARLEAGKAPGFKDRNKDENSTGDYLWWAELLRYAKSVTTGPVLVVTNDTTKGDWTYTKKGIRIGAHLELVDEMYRETGHQLLITTVSELVQFAGTHLDVGSAVSQETVAEAQDIALSAKLKRDSEQPLDRKDSHQRPISLDEAADVSGISAELLRYFVDAGLLRGLHPEPSSDEFHFHPRDVARAMFVNAAYVMGISRRQLRGFADSLPPGTLNYNATLYMKDGELFVSLDRDDLDGLVKGGWKRLSPPFGELLDVVTSSWPPNRVRLVKRRRTRSASDERARRLAHRRELLEEVELQIARAEGEPGDMSPQIDFLRDEAAYLRAAIRRELEEDGTD